MPSLKGRTPHLQFVFGCLEQETEMGVAWGRMAAEASSHENHPSLLPCSARRRGASLAAPETAVGSQKSSSLVRS